LPLPLCLRLQSVVEEQLVQFVPRLSVELLERPVRVADDLRSPLDRERFRPVRSFTFGLVLELELEVVVDDLAAEEAT